MTLEGSFHKGFSANPIRLIQEGKLKIMLSLSRDTQGYFFEVPINENGDAIIPKDSPIAKLLFTVEDGKLNF